MQEEQLLCSSAFVLRLRYFRRSLRSVITTESVLCTVQYLPFGAVLQSVAYLIFGLKQDVLEFGGAGPVDCQLVIQITDPTHLHLSGGVCGHCT